MNEGGFTKAQRVCALWTGEGWLRNWCRGGNRMGIGMDSICLIGLGDGILTGEGDESVSDFGLERRFHCLGFRNLAQMI